jgi:hypothetical protein
MPRLLVGALALVAILDFAFIAGLAATHHPFLIPLAGSLAAFVPACVVAAMAMSGRLPKSGPSRVR